MPDDTRENLKASWEKEIAARKVARLGDSAANIGFVGALATQTSEYFSKDPAKPRKWRAVLFTISGLSVVAGVITSWIKGREADGLREQTLMIEHARHTGESQGR